MQEFRRRHEFCALNPLIQYSHLLVVSDTHLSQILSLFLPLRLIFRTLVYCSLLELKKANRIESNGKWRE